MCVATSGVCTDRGQTRTARLRPSMLLYAPLTYESENKERTMAEEKCKNPVCSCPPQPDGKYCSASCEGAGKTIELDCDCGHKECSGNF